MVIPQQPGSTTIWGWRYSSCLWRCLRYRISLPGCRRTPGSGSRTAMMSSCRCRSDKEEERNWTRARESFSAAQTSQLFCYSVSSLYAGYNEKQYISRWTRYDPRWPRHPMTLSHSVIIHQERQTRKREEEWASYTRSTIYVHVRV